MNAYLIERDPAGVVLVDCGTAGHVTCWAALVEGLSLTGHRIADVADLVITHAHSDHMGLAARIVAESGCTMRMHPAHEAFTDGALEPERIRAAREGRARDEGVPAELVPIYGDIAEERDGALSPLPAFEALRSGTGISSRLGVWEVLETPGHTPSHVLLHQPEARIAIVGDLISRTFAPWYDYGYSADPVAEFLSSLEALESLEVAVALPGHGRPIEDVREVVEMHRDELGRRLQAVTSALAEPASAYEVCERVFGPSESIHLAVWRLLETIAYLRHLRLLGRVVREEPEGRPFRYVLAASDLVPGAAVARG